MNVMHLLRTRQRDANQEATAYFCICHTMQ